MKSLHKSLIIVFCLILLFQCKKAPSTGSDPNVVTFSDINFELAIRESLNKLNGDITKSDMLTIIYLEGWSKGIISIDGIEYCENLEVINLRNNQISDISSLTDLQNINYIDIAKNQIADINALTNLTNLLELTISDNQISDISALTGLINLKYLNLSVNKISDIQPLIQNQGINDGDTVTLYSNPLSEISINTFIPQLVDRGVDISY